MLVGGAVVGGAGGYAGVWTCGGLGALLDITVMTTIPPTTTAATQTTVAAQATTADVTVTTAADTPDKMAPVTEGSTGWQYPLDSGIHSV